MNNEQRQRRFQFSLRKLLLWMAVLAVYLGVLRLITEAVSGTLITIGWLAIIVAVRMKWGARRGSTVAVAGTGFCLSVIFVVLSHPLEEMIFGVLVGTLVGAVLGLLGSFVAERSLRFVDFLDRLMQTKTPHDDAGENNS